MTPITCDLRDADDLQFVGGKGANLGRLLRLGFLVPPGFVVTTMAYRAALASGELSEADPEQLHARLLDVTLPAEVSGPILAAYRQLGAAAVAVRSSGTAEAAAEPEASTIVMCRLDARSVDALEALIEAGVRTTRSDAVAWLVQVGIEANTPLLATVQETVAEIRRLRVQAQTLAQRALAGEGPDKPTRAGQA